LRENIVERNGEGKVQRKSSNAPEIVAVIRITPWQDVSRRVSG
jgi:hypothetical protein